MSLDIIIGEMNEKGIIASFDILFPDKRHLREATGFLAKEYQYVAKKAVKHEVYHERVASLEEDCPFTPSLRISPIGNLDFGKTDYFLIETGGSGLARERLQEFRNHLNQKYS